MASRDRQPAGKGLVNQFTSPRRRRANKPDTYKAVNPGKATRVAALRRELDRLHAIGRQSEPGSVEDAERDWMDVDDVEDTSAPSAVVEPQTPEDELNVDDPSTAFPIKQHRRTVPNDEGRRLYAQWHLLLPQLVNPLLAYSKAAAGQPVPSFKPLPRGGCNIPAYHETHEIEYCMCTSLPEVIISIGMFPTSPTQPRVAVSIPLLDFYYALFECSGDAVTAMAAAIQGEPVRHPFRRGLGYAIQWYDALRIKIERSVEAAVDAARAHVASFQAAPSGNTGAPASAEGEPMAVDPRTTSTSDSTEQPASAHTLPDDLINSKPRTECARILQKRCRACFAGSSWGSSFDSGGDVHVAVDANFSHRHLRNAGDSPWFLDADYFLSKEEVDAVGERIARVRKSQPKPKVPPKVPDEALDGCENGHEAADGSTKTNDTMFDDTGVAALVCRHDIPLFLVNIDTPGEQQKYAVSLVEHFVSLLPPVATVAVFYDIGCVVDRSLNLYDILPSAVTERLAWATSAMHAYGHEWACQLVYKPRLRKGLGLTDGEGVERLWSRLRKLIAVTRTSGRSRRLWLLDRQVHVIGEDLRDDLGDFISRRLRRGVTAQGDQAQEDLEECGVPVLELQKQWELQHAPAWLKKDINVVLTLQTEIDGLDKCLKCARLHLEEGDLSEASIAVLHTLESAHRKLLTRVDTLYASLNVEELYPDLVGIDFASVRTLLLARDLKINIRNRAIASFLEWDRLDQAVGGRNNPLGTKMHQKTRKSISKRKPALLTAIRKFNKYCKILRDMQQPEWGIPIPTDLSTNLAIIREDPLLLQDVWVTPTSPQDTPRWLEDASEKGSARRCLEERRRLGREADNLCRWFGSELCALEVALQHRLRLETVRLLGARWLTPLTSAFRFDWHRRNSVNAARHICGEAGTLQFSWITPLTSIYWNNELIQDAEELRDHPEDDAVMHGLHPDDISDQQLLMDLMDD
ncbi:hypothetical protein PLICRDRAFT_58527 [Plicaturopsis crispa FD-325 SS-3]|uniref:CxC1-like cysteine cluster associated with KDZ transposases domain-containing protein n=1 Tax=Plicaturopsis crispa FD-325 SS-3 TaxID=944288 RepID=A0A0C9SK67_PLICR|nr:hypothetical protein PLICRDRAFT_58527 [Plicaturopsis crispa FD-325 SS-3]